MSILSAHNVGLSFGAFDLFRGISVTIANDSKIGLIGPNGIGKTSLMMILAGLSQPTTGNSLLYLNGDRGAADDNTGALTTLIDATKSWVANEWIGCYAVLTAGPGSENAGRALK